MAVATKTLTGAPLPWDDVNWDEVQKQVRRLQIRIAKATREGRFNKARALQRLLTRSFYGKLTAVKRVVSNKGAKTPGVDNEVWNTAKRKWAAVLDLNHKGYNTQPLRRVYIPKANGKLRPLSIPVMKCRAMQALHLLALEPVTETLADPNSYGFRPKRSVADAIQQCFLGLCRKSSSRWVLEGDIRSCFDTISHEWLLDHAPMELKVLRKWLKAGYVESQTLYRTEEGTPQGGVISPTLLVLTLTGLEAAVQSVVEKSDKVNVVVYADDFIVTGATKEVLEQKVKPAIEAFLRERGLQLCAEKTLITHIDDGFDFLGFNVRKYDEKLLIKPSKRAVKRFLENIRQTARSNKHARRDNLIRMLNSKITGWANFYRHVCSGQTFGKVDTRIFECVYRWARKRHPNKGPRWVRLKYFTSVQSRQWIFYAPRGGNYQLPFFLKWLIDFKIVRHLKIRADANPYFPSNDEYFVSLAEQRKERSLDKEGLGATLRRKQSTRVSPKGRS